ncbi:MAG TPA: ferredoxin family protein [Verrucomicrobiales bacterium]|nr:ferredoxin family protein [Verrucomicrobiales bacterium]HIL70169.1 ferredoxin family protein [Verrucomicrobiota bacterium]
MNRLEQKTVKVVVYDGEGSQSISAEESYEAISGLLNNGFTVARITSKSELGISNTTPQLVLGKFDGKQLNGAESGAGASTVRLSEFPSSDPNTVSEIAEQYRQEQDAFDHSSWKPWFPVIDYDRCTNCMQCLSFCLFGVYGVDDEQQIQVQNQDSCKTNCPACSRVCPEVAILFPKYKAGPINGAPVSQDDLDREKMKVDISSLLGGDVYSMLRNRSVQAQSRFSKERSSDKALNERKKCLDKLKQDIDIPAEVLMSLPSSDEILEKAEQAKLRGEEALAAIRNSPNSSKLGSS